MDKIIEVIFTAMLIDQSLHLRYRKCILDKKCEMSVAWDDLCCTFVLTQESRLKESSSR
jgi:hypothetical protein